MIYFDNAATTRFKPNSVKRAMIQELRHSANPGRSGHSESIRAAMIVNECREEIAKRFFDGNVVFTKNCTEALNLAIFGIKHKRVAIATIFDHNSVLRPLKKISESGETELRIIAPKNGDMLKSLQNALVGDVGLVVLPAMSNVTGKALDVSALAREVKQKTNALVLVDMAQAAGHVKIDFSDVDLCAFAGHKSLHGPQGTGFLLIKREVSLTPLLYGGTGTSSFSLSQPTDAPEGLEAGTLNTVGIAGLKSGIAYTYDHFLSLSEHRNKIFVSLKNGLSQIKGVKIISAENGIVLLNFDSIDCSDGADRLNDYGIGVRSGLHCAPFAHRYLGTLPYGAIRFSVGVDNTLTDVERTLEVVEKIANTQPTYRI